MEGYPPREEAIDLMVERTGFPRAAFRTLEKHCHLDTHHRDDFNLALDALLLTDEHHAILEVSALHTIRAAARCYGEVLEQAPATPALASANGQGASRMPLRRPELTARRAAENGVYRVEDALGGDIYQIGEQERFLLMQCDGRQSPDEACRAYGSRFGHLLTHAELDDFLEVARTEQLLVTEGT
jgi:hypothetical protein